LVSRRRGGGGPIAAQLALLIWTSRVRGLAVKPISFRLNAASDELLHLDVLRFIASAGIVFHHSHEFFYPEVERAAVGFATAGLAQCVDLFFVISGFVIAYVYAGRITSLGEFGRLMQRPIGRLVPLHFLTLLVSIAVYAAAARVGANMSHPPSFRLDCIAATAALLPAAPSCGLALFKYCQYFSSLCVCR